MKTVSRSSTSLKFLIVLGLCVFFYSWSIGLLLQLFLIPKLFSHQGATEGLVILDSIGFNQIAKAKAVEISTLGWSAWELRPASQSPAGIASFFYVLFGPTPLSLLPFNSLLHALSTCTVMLMLRNFFSIRASLVGASIFALNPASFEWVSQIHRDGVFILGNLFFIFGLMNLFRAHLGYASSRARCIYISVILSTLGTWFVWVARPYWIQIMVVITLTSLICTILSIFTCHIHRNSFRDSGFVAGLVLILLTQLFVLKYSTVYDPLSPGLPSYQAITSHSTASHSTNFKNPVSLTWKTERWVPHSIDSTLYKLAYARQGAIVNGGNTLIDANIHLNSSVAFFKYLPRALQIGLLTPFPNHWVGTASTPAMTIGRKVLGCSTLLSYFCLLGASLGLYKLRKSLILWVMVGSCLMGILTYSYIYPNIGALARFRYGFYMLLVAFGAAFWTELWSRSQSTHKTK